MTLSKIKYSAASDEVLSDFMDVHTDLGQLVANAMVKSGSLIITPNIAKLITLHAQRVPIL
jgi:hypothetical protein